MVRGEQMAQPQQVQSDERAERVRRIGVAVEEQREALVSFLQALVREPSVTGDEGRVQALIAAQMERMGLEVVVWEPDLVDLAPYAEHVGEFATLAGRPDVFGTLRGTADGRSLILNAH